MGSGTDAFFSDCEVLPFRLKALVFLCREPWRWYCGLCPQQRPSLCSTAPLTGMSAFYFFVRSNSVVSTPERNNFRMARTDREPHTAFFNAELFQTSIRCFWRSSFHLGSSKRREHSSAVSRTEPEKNRARIHIVEILGKIDLGVAAGHHFGGRPGRTGGSDSGGSSGKAARSAASCTKVTLV